MGYAVSRALAEPLGSNPRPPWFLETHKEGNTMTENVTTDTDLDTDLDTEVEPPAKPTAKPTTDDFDKDTWQHKVQQASVLFARSDNAKNKASKMLWEGASASIAEWMSDSDNDVNAEGLSNDLLFIMGTSRKGDVSKIKSVALAVRNHGLDLSQHANLYQAYNEANRLTKKAPAEKAEDDAAEKAVESIEAPKTATTASSAAALLLSNEGVDGTVVAILDALNGPSGDFNEGAARSFARSVMAEVAARVEAAKPKPAPKAERTTPKSGAAKATAKTAPASAKPASGSKAKPVSRTKGDPNARVLPNAEREAVTDDAPSDEAPAAEDIFSDIEGDESAEAPAPAPKPAATKAKPVRRPVKKA